MIPQRLQRIFTRTGSIQTWLLTTHEYRSLLTCGWTRRVGTDGGFILIP